MDPVLEQLKNGVRRFRSEISPAQAELFAQAAAEPQRPHTLFITCADSRIDPNALTSTGPGEVFVTRNIGNMVPAYGEMLGGVSAVIEFAVSALGVRHTVICGHTDCGAMKALLDPASTTEMPSVRNWLKNAQTALAVANTLHEHALPASGHAHSAGCLISQQDRPLIGTLTEQNVLLQIQHLKTHPSVASAITLGNLTVSGWIYDIATGNVRISENNDPTFAPLA
ncbi:MAG TPA: carbonic anhydrase [Candidatus Aquilonibacter sp.]|nr:carbonic anhydrase [Candidatus Aquilonibacter sp.]